MSTTTITHPMPMVNDQNLLHDAAVTTKIHEGTTNNLRNITKISIEQKYNKNRIIKGSKMKSKNIHKEN